MLEVYNFRQKKTFLWLFIATVLCSILGYYKENLTINLLLVPIIFGLALTLSNNKYIKADFFYIIIPVSFFLIFFYLSPSGAQIIEMSLNVDFNNKFGWHVISYLVASTLVILIVKIALRAIIIRWEQVIIMSILSFISASLVGIFTGFDDSQFRFAIVILVYQFSMTFNIVVTMEDDNIVENINTSAPNHT